MATDSLQTFGNVQVVEVGPLGLTLTREDRCDHLTTDDQRCVIGFLFTGIPRLTIGALGFPIIVPAEDQRTTGETLAHGLGDRE
ncbi:hypothetical protein D3C81_1890610 [compost metagenome]